MTRWHGLEVLLAAASHAAWPPGLDLVLIGDGQLVESVRSLSGKSGGPEVTHLPSVPQSTLASYINSARVGLVPSNSIGERASFGLSPLKLYEMLACGLPVVVTDFPGQADLVRSLHAGIVVPPDDADAIARAVAQLHASPPPRSDMARVAENIHRYHEWKNRSQQVARILDEVTRRHSSPE